jgi:PEP-CTERM motif
MKHLVLTLALGAAVAASPAFAATTIDFSTFAPGTTISNQIPGVSLALSGAGQSGSPTVNVPFDDATALINANNDNGSNFYPSGTTITFSFAQLVSGLSFTFNNYGDNSDSEFQSNYSAFDAGGALVSAGLLGSVQNFDLVSVAGSGISRLLVSNDGTDQWTYGIGELTFTADAAGAVPEPATWGMMILGFGVIGGAMRRRAKVTTTVSYA